MMGDFNETMWQHEHFSASRRAEKQMRDFRDVCPNATSMTWATMGYPGLMITSGMDQKM
jgi:hypothetical protein